MTIENCRFIGGHVTYHRGLRCAVFIMIRIQPLQDGRVEITAVDSRSLEPHAGYESCIISRSEYNRRPKSERNEVWWARSKCRMIIEKP